MKTELTKEQLKLFVQVEQEAHERELLYLQRRHEAELEYLKEMYNLNLRHDDHMRSLLAQVDSAKNLPDLVREAAKSEAEETRHRFPDIFERETQEALKAIIAPPKAKRKPHKYRKDRRRNEKK